MQIASTTEERWLCITDYAVAYGVTRPTVYKWLDAGILETYKVQRVIRIRNIPPDQHSVSVERKPLSTLSSSY